MKGQQASVLKVKQTRHQHRLCRGLALAGSKEPYPLPVDQRRKLHQLMSAIDHVDQTRTQQVTLFLTAWAVLYGKNQNDRVSNINIQNFGPTGEKSRPVSTQINDTGLFKIN
jgi:hypothetical protein